MPIITASPMTMVINAIIKLLSSRSIINTIKGIEHISATVMMFKRYLLGRRKLIIINTAIAAVETKYSVGNR